jgi:hypothetical protein
VCWIWGQVCTTYWPSLSTGRCIRYQRAVAAIQTPGEGCCDSWSLQSWLENHRSNGDYGKSWSCGCLSGRRAVGGVSATYNKIMRLPLDMLHYHYNSAVIFFFPSMGCVVSPTPNPIPIKIGRNPLYLHNQSSLQYRLPMAIPNQSVILYQNGRGFNFTLMPKSFMRQPNALPNIPPSIIYGLGQLRDMSSSERA